jgi:ribosomal protein S18 acetylase RimI-like enzyme/catechol 2,3-dioxygenase-like lactoylglutathione lyase family enzyme
MPLAKFDPAAARRRRTEPAASRRGRPLRRAAWVLRALRSIDRVDAGCPLFEVDPRPSRAGGDATRRRGAPPATLLTPLEEGPREGSTERTGRTKWGRLVGGEMKPPARRELRRVARESAVRRLRADEWRAFRDLRLDSLRSDPLAFGSTYERESVYAKEKWEGWCRDGAAGGRAVTFVAVSPSEELVGMVGAYFAEGTPHVWGMWTRPAWRNQGIGRHLMERLLAWLERYRSARTIRLDVNPTQVAAVRLYSTLGFRFRGVPVPLGHHPPAVCHPMVRGPGRRARPDRSRRAVNEGGSAAAAVNTPRGSNGAVRARFVYSGIRVRDPRRSLRFYRRLGFRLVRRGAFPHGGSYVHLRFPGSTHRIELNFYPTRSRFFRPFTPGEEFDHFGFYAPDPDRWLRTMVRAGAKRRLDFEDDIQRLVFVTDPDGVWWGAYGPKRTRPGRKSAIPARRTRARASSTH